MITTRVDSHCPHEKYVENSFPQDAQNILGIIVFQYEVAEFQKLRFHYKSEKRFLFRFSCATLLTT